MSFVILIVEIGILDGYAKNRDRCMPRPEDPDLIHNKQPAVSTFINDD